MKITVNKNNYKFSLINKIGVIVYQVYLVVMQFSSMWLVENPYNNIELTAVIIIKPLCVNGYPLNELWSRRHIGINFLSSRPLCFKSWKNGSDSVDVSVNKIPFNSMRSNSKWHLTYFHISAIINSTIEIHEHNKNLWKR